MGRQADLLLPTPGKKKKKKRRTRLRSRVLTPTGAPNSVLSGRWFVQKHLLEKCLQVAIWLSDLRGISQPPHAPLHGNGALFFRFPCQLAGFSQQEAWVKDWDVGRRQRGARVVLTVSVSPAAVASQAAFEELPVSSPSLSSQAILSSVVSESTGQACHWVSFCRWLQLWTLVTLAWPLVPLALTHGRGLLQLPVSELHHQLRLLGIPGSSHYQNNLFSVAVDFSQFRIPIKVSPYPSFPFPFFF